jgi:DNA topoisomerase-1
MLRHSTDSKPGITRKKNGLGWAYFAPDGKRIADRDEIDRLNAIALPPAYGHAWFCPDPDGHLQATGRDARGRKQYRYHEKFRARRDKSKFADTLDFGAALPKIRRRVETDLKKRKLSRDTVLAAVVRLLDTQHIRIGNEQYAKSNKSFGATTLRNRHLKKRGNKLIMKFSGKHGIVHEVAITDANLKRIVARCQDLPGLNLFQYVGDDGEPHAITSADVNTYLREALGGDFTAKSFRTWGANVIAFERMLGSEEGRRLSVKTMVEPVAEALGNTVAMSRKSYVHLRLIEAMRDNSRNALAGFETPRPRRRLSRAEVSMMAFIEKQSRRRKADKTAKA